MGPFAPFLEHSPLGTLPRLRGKSARLLRFLAPVFLFGILLTCGPGEGRGLAAQREEVREDELPPPIQDTEETAARRALGILAGKMRAKAAADVKSALSKVKTPHPEAVGQALMAELQEEDAETAVTSASTIEKLGDLDDDGNPELVFKWSRAERFPLEHSDAESLLPAWTLFLLSWDGSGWRASKLMEGNGLYDLRVLPKLGAALAVVVIEGLSLVPFPAIFRFERHAATLAWDSRDEESRYQGFAGGEVEFQHVAGVESPVMVVSGKADPGFLTFPRASRRGFLAMTVYTWDGKSYIPRRTEYSENEDYVLYRFLSALHLHDYRGAYALIDPPRFLKTSEPSVELFEKYVAQSWPELLKNNIFEARECAEDARDAYSFELSRGGTVLVYRPAFSSDSKHLLTGLERKEE